MSSNKVQMNCRLNRDLKLKLEEDFSQIKEQSRRLDNINHRIDVPDETDWRIGLIHTQQFLKGSLKNQYRYLKEHRSKLTIC